MGVVAPPQAPPFPFTVEQFVAEVSPPSAAATASQACAAFAQLATKVVVPETFRAAVPAVLGLVAREGDGLLEAKESAVLQGKRDTLKVGQRCEINKDDEFRGEVKFVGYLDCKQPGTWVRFACSPN